MVATWRLEFDSSLERIYGGWFKKIASVGENGLRKHFATSSWVVGFGPRSASDLRREFCNGDLMKTLMLLELCEFCCTGTAQPNGAGLRCESADG
jgi:hypothetical protein